MSEQQQPPIQLAKFYKNTIGVQFYIAALKVALYMCRSNVAIKRDYSKKSRGKTVLVDIFFDPNQKELCLSGLNSLQRFHIHVMARILGIKSESQDVEGSDERVLIVTKRPSGRIISPAMKFIEKKLLECAVKGFYGDCRYWGMFNGYRDDTNFKFDFDFKYEGLTFDEDNCLCRLADYLNLNFNIEDNSIPTSIKPDPVTTLTISMNKFFDSIPWRIRETYTAENAKIYHIVKEIPYLHRRAFVDV